MAGIRLTRHIEAEPRLVFAFFSDFERSADFIDEITRLRMLTDGPVGQGTRFKETRVMFGREHTEEFEVTEYQPDGEQPTYTLRSGSGSIIFVCRFDFVPENRGTAVEFDMQFHPMTFTSKVIVLSAGWFMRRMMRKGIANDLDAMKRTIEDHLPSSDRGP